MTSTFSLDLGSRRFLSIQLEAPYEVVHVNVIERGGGGKETFQMQNSIAVKLRLSHLNPL